MQTIRLTRGFVSVVDDEDADLASLAWAVHGTQRSGIYASRNLPGSRGKKILMHSLIAARMHVDLRGRVVDHINGNKLDNRRSNLRAATRLENQYNARLRSDSSTGLNGVTFNGGKWVARTTINGVKTHLGRFDNILDAAVAHDRAVYEHHGAFARATYPRCACGLGDP